MFVIHNSLLTHGRIEDRGGGGEGGPNFDSDILLKLFCDMLLIPYTTESPPPPVSIFYTLHKISR